MRVFTAHLRDGRAPVLVREGFSLAAAVFGPVWLLAHRAWIAAVLVACVVAAIALLAPPALGVVLAVALAWLLGLFGHDLRRWSLARAGFTLTHVVAARDGDDALARLVDERPELLRPALS